MKKMQSVVGMMGRKRASEKRNSTHWMQIISLCLEGVLKEDISVSKNRKNFILIFGCGFHHPQDNFLKSLRPFTNASVFGKVDIHFRFLRMHSLCRDPITSFADSSFPNNLLAFRHFPSDLCSVLPHYLSFLVKNTQLILILLRIKSKYQHVI